MSHTMTLTPRFVTKAGLAWLGLSFLLSTATLNAALEVERTFSNLNIPLFDFDPVANVQSLDFGDATVDNLRVSVDIGGFSAADPAFNGDYFISVANSGGGFAVLANRVGRTSENAFGYGDNGFNVTFDDAAAHDIHTYRTVDGATPAYPQPVTGTWQSSGRVAQPGDVLDSTPRSEAARLGSFDGTAASGDWWLTVEDTSAGGNGMLHSWGVQMQLTPQTSGELNFVAGDRIRTPNGSDLMISSDFNLGGETSFVGSGNIRLKGQLRGSGTLVQSGSGTLTLSEDSNDMLGAVEVRSGVLRVNNTSGSATGSGTVTVFSGATLAGNGRVGGPVTFNSGSFLSPGASPGTQTYDDDVTWEGGAAYLWEINDAAGTRGADPGWDWIDVAGQLTLAADSLNPFIIRVLSLDLSNESGAIANFDGLSDYIWTLATAGSIADFDPDHVEIDSSDFEARNANANGTFSLVQSDNHLNLHYNAIPEPHTYALGLGIGSILVALWRRTRKTRHAKRS